jgi:hypothetical protein
VLPFPFHFLDGNHAMNVQPLNYQWEEFYQRASDLALYAFSPRRNYRRWMANRGLGTKALNLVRATSSHRGEYQSKIARRLKTNKQLQAFMAGESEVLPNFYSKKIRSNLGPLWDALPEGAVMHDQNAYLKRHEAAAIVAAE